jgi:proton-translocating NADH-quinone oxidoreductase, chain M
MIPVLLILIPLLTGLATFFIRNEKAIRSFILVVSIVVLVISLVGIIFFRDTRLMEHHSAFMTVLGSSLSLRLDGMGQLLCLLTAIAFVLIFLSSWDSLFRYKKANNFFALMMLSQAGLMGVFLAMDALLFYFFWELALIPVYFLCSQWGGERRIAVTFKFFIYTFVGSLLMLIGILYVAGHNPDQSFSIDSFYKAKLSFKEQSWLFWLFFIAFAIKMPVFPFHTWQPDTYEQSPTPVTMILSGVMVKMGLLGVIRWLLPLFPAAANNWATLISTLCIVGIIYASLIAMRQDDLKRLIAYSSIAHIGLMCLAVFAHNTIGLQGVMLQMFNHGINIIGLWILVEMIEKRFGTRKMSELGGLAQKNPSMAIFFVLIALGNIALPLTNAFIGEFMMFNGIFSSNVYDGNYTIFGTIRLNANSFATVYTICAGLGIILAAVYTLNMIRKVFYGETVTAIAGAKDIRRYERLALLMIVIMILGIGIYPQAVLNITNDVTDSILKISDLVKDLKK